MVKKKAVLSGLFTLLLILFAFLMGSRIYAQDSAKSITVGAPGGEAVYGKTAVIEYPVTVEGLAEGERPHLVWEKGEPQDVLPEFRDGILSFRVFDTAPAGEYRFYLQVGDGETAVKSPIAVLSVKKADYPEDQKQLTFSGVTALHNQSYNINLNKYLPSGFTVDAENIKYEGKALFNLAYKNGEISFEVDEYLEQSVKAYVKVPVISADNYNPFDITLEIKVTARKLVIITGITTVTKEYDGQPFRFGQPVANTQNGHRTDLTEKDFKVYFITEDGQTLFTPPTEVGKYTLKCIVKRDNEKYYGSTEREITITKKTVTLKPVAVEREPGEEILPITFTQTGLLPLDAQGFERILGDLPLYRVTLKGEDVPLQTAFTQLGEYLLFFQNEKEILAQLEGSSLGENYRFELDSSTFSVVPHRHIREVRNRVEPTCFAEGYSGDVYCAKCGELLEKGEILPKKEHFYRNGFCVYCGTKEPVDTETPGGDVTPEPETPEPGKPDIGGETEPPEEPGEEEKKDSAKTVIWIVSVSGAVIGGTVGGILGVKYAKKKEKTPKDKK